jgi:preprotein translocase subunit SecA
VSVIFPITLSPGQLARSGEDIEEIKERLAEDAQSVYTRRGDELGESLLRTLERTVVLSIVDNKWREQLAELDYLRSGVGLRAMGQRDPLTEYQRESFDMFSDMVDGIKVDSVRYLFHSQVVEQQNRPDPVVRLGGTGGAAFKKQAKVGDKVGRNDPCHCGSGKKYKKCHGAAS